MSRHHTPAKTILIVDDYSDARELLRHYLKRIGYLVVEAANGLEGLERAQQLHPDLIIMDLSMPVLDGLEATRSIQQDAQLRDTPIVIISAHGERGIELFSTQADILISNLEYLPKPIDLAVLVDMLASLAPLS